MTVALTTILASTSWGTPAQSSHSQIPDPQELPIVVISFQVIYYATIEN